MSSVSRKVYQALAEQNKRLMKDIKVLVDQDNPLYHDVVNKWKNRHQKQESFNNAIRELLGIKTDK